MIDIKQYITVFQQKLEEVFKNEIFFFGLQGSYARGEATENSDIDVVVILQELTEKQLLQYQNIIDTLPYREKLCGFVSGKQELLHWTAEELFQFYYDTTAIVGNLDSLLPLITTEKIKNAVKTGACTIYHGSCHNMLHEKSTEVLKALYKSAVFVLQAKYFLKTSEYCKTKKQLQKYVSKQDEKIFSVAQKKCEITEQNIQRLSIDLMQWASDIITTQSD